ncbi:VOC family protein [Cognatishimia sp. WU-CL00825]|uniref:VOC family protein n=1 Tax=Cognatishimia sp. WU-CL00825 TaxID=3127658 RepID=UPI0031095702
MSVKRIVANIATKEVAEVQAFYRSLFDLDVAMDFGWISTLTSGTEAAVQISIASQGGSGTQVPDLSIEVEDVDAVYARAKSLGHAIDYALTDEPWGVRRFYLRDPSGKLLNILAHLD